MSTSPELVQEHILKKYELVKKLGSGAYGHVWKVREIKSGKIFALKKIFDAFQHSTDAQRTYREVSVLRQLSHSNIVILHQVLKPEKSLKDVYLVFEYMETDFHNVVCDNVLQEVHKRYIVYQVLKGLKYLHSADLVHRDLKPSNILLNSDCLTKICDFGLVRSVAKEDDDSPVLTEGVATRWYRAPEVLLGSKDYDQKADMWSVGCIIAEILTQKPLFPGSSTLNQLQRILSFTGRPSPADIASLKSDLAKTMIDELKNPLKTKDPKELFSIHANQDAFDLMQKLLQFNPNKRLTAAQALNHKYVADFSNKKEQVQFKGKVIFEINDNVKLGIQDYRKMVFAYAQQPIGNPTSLSPNTSRVANRFESPKKFSDLKKVSAARKESKNNSQANITPPKPKSPVINQTLVNPAQTNTTTMVTAKQQALLSRNPVGSSTLMQQFNRPKQGSPNSFKQIIERDLKEKENLTDVTSRTINNNKENQQLNGTSKLGDLLGKKEKECGFNARAAMSPKFISHQNRMGAHGPTFSGLNHYKPL